MDGKVQPARGSHNEVYIKGVVQGFYMQNQMRLVKEIVYMHRSKRLCVKVEMITGETDYVPLVTQDIEWIFCDRKGNPINVK